MIAIQELNLKEALVQLCDTQKEIKALEKSIAETERKAYINDKVQSSSKNFPFSKTNIEVQGIDKRYTLRLEHYNLILKNRYEKLVKQQIKATEFIENIPDSKLRMIFEYRYIYQLSWTKIGFKIGCSSDTVRMKHNRFLEEIT